MANFRIRAREGVREREGEHRRGGGRCRHTDVAGGLKCSSRDLTLEFAGNRTGLRGGYVCVCVCSCVSVSKSVWAC